MLSADLIDVCLTRELDIVRCMINIETIVHGQAALMFDCNGQTVIDSIEEYIASAIDLC